MAIIGIIVLFVSAQQIQAFSIRTNVQEVASSSQKDKGDDSKPVTLLDMDHDLIVSNVHFHVNHVFYEIMNIEQDEQEDDFENTDLIYLPDDFRKVLFSQVISPNAP